VLFRLPSNQLRSPVRVGAMEQYGRSSEGSRSDPSPEWAGPGAQTGLEGISLSLYIFIYLPFLFSAVRFVRFGDFDLWFWGNVGVSEPGSILIVENAEPMWQLGLGAAEESYPQRPNEADCTYYLRTGFCGFGSRCRFNHPRDRGTVILLLFLLLLNSFHP